MEGTGDMGALKYYAIFAFVPLAALGFYFGGIWAFAMPFFIFGVLPAVEILLPPGRKNLEPEEEKEARRSRLYDAVLYLVAPAQAGLLLYFLHTMAAGRLDAVSTAGAVWTMGLCCGVFGINAAHELGHRRTRFEQFLAKTLLLTSLYMHFFIEHNRGHHARIATDEDPASARRGQWLYSFWARSAVGGWLSAWRLENGRLGRRGRHWLSFGNQMLRFQLIQLVVVAGAFAYFGVRAGLFFLAAAGIGVLLLETVNYIEHYGLRRRRLSNGRYERVTEAHSWNSDHVLGRLLLLELTRHSDHHMNASRKFQVLRHLDAGPQMPTGYPGMMTLALLPPLWFRVMDRRIDLS